MLLSVPEFLLSRMSNLTIRIVVCKLPQAQG
jgi:hypothetical protein